MLLESQEEHDLRADLRRAALITVLMTVAGVALGLLWLWLAPRVPLVSDNQAVFLSDSEGEQAIGADGTFVLLALAFGAVAAALVFWFFRRGGIAPVAASPWAGCSGRWSPGGRRLVRAGTGCGRPRT